MNDVQEKEPEILENLDVSEETSVHLTDEEIGDVIDALKAEDSDVVHSALDDLGPADIAELLEKIKQEDRDNLIKLYGHALDPSVFTEMDTELIRLTLSEMPAKQISGMISKLESDDALLLLEPLSPNLQQKVLRNLSHQTRATMEEGLSFAEDSAGRLMRREMVAIPEFWTIGKTIDYLRSASNDLPEDFFDVFIIDPAYHLKGEIPLSKIIRAKRSEKIMDLNLQEPHPIPADMDQEDVAHLFRRENIVSAPVVDKNNRLIGTITIDDVVDVIDKEAQEDLLRMAGVDQGDMYRAIISTAGTRFRWLFINLLTAIFASIVISLFDATIQEIVALAILMPIVASMGGNAGTQALTVAVRAIATHQLSATNTMRVIWKETLVGAINGILFAVIIGFTAAIWFSSPILGVVIASAMLINLLVAGLFGAGIPIVLNATGSDPAVSSTVLLTTVTDVIGFLAFLGLAAFFLV
ncbi:MAG: magnesium transporter [Alphaproteobacteria bacterium]|nr:magnesium transporter [Alphaproteobacteria bacterium]